MYFSSWFASQLMTLLFLLASLPTSAYNLYSYLDYLFIYLASQHLKKIFLNRNRLHLFWSIQGLPSQAIFEMLYQLLIDKYKSINEMYFWVICITLISLFRCTQI